MANATIPTKTDLQEAIDRAVEVLDEAYEPESTREDLAEAVGKALDILNDEEDEDDDEDGGDEGYDGD
jgi:hypothetical protein